MDYVDFIKVCPEVGIGLGVPREPIRIIKDKGEYRLVQPKTGRDVTKNMDDFTDDFINKLPEVDGFIFKSRSPTIGLKSIKVYKGPFDPMVVETRSGFFADKILKKYSGYPMEEEQRLNNKKIRHIFLTALYAFAGLREAKVSREALKEFHKKNKFLIKAYNSGSYEKLGKILEKGMPYEDYYREFREVFLKMPSHEPFALIAQEIFNKYSDKVNTQERSWFHDALKKYEDNKISWNDLLEDLRLFVTKFNDEEMQSQTIFEPYPPALLSDVDLERDIDYSIIQ
jgi:uncharacterized protein YbbK (DUF523 family)/uncharacterized protein YbgA (DUF1722 family)